ncbi:hypothetical protein E2C01_070445 [Portunus trituberculatus]|uniref:Uncharacterized protein n=1 Tax=Portunus trituberculatus TaxID=210409 RepID=A0A5B7I5F8_PORTR|nr:hypothetical protein [Portunus trituberculatus]
MRQGAASWATPICWHWWPLPWRPTVLCWPGLSPTRITRTTGRTLTICDVPVCPEVTSLGTVMVTLLLRNVTANFSNLSAVHKYHWQILVTEKEYFDQLIKASVN